MGTGKKRWSKLAALTLALGAALAFTAACGGPASTAATGAERDGAR